MAFRHRQREKETISISSKEPEIKIVTEEIKPEVIEHIKQKKNIPSPEEIEREKKTEARKRGVNKTKPFLNIAIMGDTVEVRDFRAICKKNGLQINNTLKTIIHEWNTANYNL